MCATIGLPVVQPLQPCGVLTLKIARANIRDGI